MNTTTRDTVLACLAVLTLLMLSFPMIAEIVTWLVIAFLIVFFIGATYVYKLQNWMYALGILALIAYFHDKSMGYY